MEHITSGDCGTILKNAYKSTLNVVLLEYGLFAAGKEQGGFFGDTFILKIRSVLDGNECKREFFVKMLPDKGERAVLAIAMGAYDKEMFFYDYLLEEYEKYNIKINFAPEYYLCKKNLLVLDELTEKKYKNHYYFDLEHSRSVLKSIALFHAGSLLYEEYKTEELGRVFRLGDEFPKIFEEKFFDMNDEKGFMSRHFQVALKCLPPLLEYLPFNADYKTKMLDLTIKKFHKIQNIFKSDILSRKVCSHGDLWRRNIMFQEETNDCKIIDYQTIRYYYPAFDVLTTLTFCTTRKLRQEHEQHLLEYYYDQLNLATNFQLTKLIPYEEFERTLTHLRFLVAYQAFAGHLLDVEEKGATPMDVIFGNRVEYACRHFQNNEEYRQTVTDDIVLLFEAAEI